MCVSEMCYITIVANLSSIIQEIDIYIYIRESFLKFILVSKITEQLVTERDKGKSVPLHEHPLPSSNYLAAISHRYSRPATRARFFPPSCIHAGNVVSISNVGAYTYYTRWVLKN